MVDKAIQEMIDNGVIDESEAPFEEKENEFDESENDSEKIELPFKVTLEDPFKWAGNEVKEIVLKNRITTAMTAHLPIHGMPKRGHFIPVISGMLGESDAFVREIGPKDFTTCVTIAYDFF